MAVRKPKPVKAGDGSYAGMVLDAWERLEAQARVAEFVGHAVNDNFRLG